MGILRVYAKEPLSGAAVEGWRRESVRRKLIGRKIEWHVAGYSSKQTGVVQETQGMGKNVLVSGNHEWAPYMLNVHVLPEEIP